MTMADLSTKFTSNRKWVGSRMTAFRIVVLGADSLKTTQLRILQTKLRSTCETQNFLSDEMVLSRCCDVVIASRPDMAKYNARYRVCIIGKDARTSS